MALLILYSNSSLRKYSWFLWFDVRNTFAVSLSDVGVVVHSKRKKVHWPLKRGKVFQVTLLSQLWCIEEKSASFSALTDYTAAFLPNCFGHIFWFLARTRPAVLGWLEKQQFPNGLRFDVRWCTIVRLFLLCDLAKNQVFDLTKYAR